MWCRGYLLFGEFGLPIKVGEEGFLGRDGIDIGGERESDYTAGCRVDHGSGIVYRSRRGSFR